MVPEMVERPRRRSLPAWFDRALSVAVLPTDSQDVRRTKRLLTGILWASIPTTMLSMAQFALVEGEPDMAVVVVLPGLAAAVTLLVVARRPTAYPAIAHLPIGVTIGVAIVVVALSEGFLGSAGNALWGVVAILGAAAVFGDRRATAWMWVYVVGIIVASWVAQWTDPVLDFEHPERAAVFNVTIVTIFVFFMMMYYVRQRAVLLDQSERLLRNILPAEIADRLKEQDGVIADHYDSASILFADVVGFTPMSADLAPADLVGFLDEVFSEIDCLVGERGLEKIKTVGDEYMVAAGVPEPRQDHAVILCDLALALRDMTRARTFAGHRIRLRMGINSGPVVAGIIGTRTFSYDLWGDAVNIASRMESSGEPDVIQVTSETQRLVADEFVCERRGVVEVKGRGPMEVWRLVARRHDPHVSGRPGGEPSGLR
jgi:guanylate cyclase